MTEISIAHCISDVLFEKNRIVLPGVGLLETKPKSAEVDHIANSVAPPSRDIGFNPNITADDGVLVNYIKKKYEKEDLVVRKIVADYMSNLSTKMQQKEIVTIPDVGRMYIDFEKKIQFLPDRVNYNKDSFGLPTVKFNDVKQPVAQPVVATPIPIVPPTNTPPRVSTAINNTPAPITQNTLSSVSEQPVQETIIPPASGTVGGRERIDFGGAVSKIFPLLLIIAFGAIAFVFYNLYNDSQDRKMDADRIAKYKDRINTKPEIDDEERAQYEEEYENEIIEKTNEGVTIDEDDDLPDGAGDTDAPTVRPGTKEGVIIVGGFSERKNAKRLVQKIYKKGYDAYIDEAGPINRVGVTFAYDEEDDIVNMVRQLRREFDNSSWVLKPKGYKVD